MKEAYDPLWDIIPAAEREHILSQHRCEYSYDFLGFTEVYIALSKIIPKHFVVIDFGCYLAAQCYCFSEHKQYVGVDVVDLERFALPNTIHYEMTIQRFLQVHKQDYPIDTTFAICSYVPDSDATELVRRHYENVFVYYPSSEKVKLKYSKEMR